jgi:hypothetical protein
MFAPPLLLALAALGAGPMGLVLGLAGAGSWTAGAWLLRDGLKAQAAYDARRMAHRPALPRKTLAAALAGAGTALATLSGDVGPVGALLYGLVAAGLHVGAFGLDPFHSKTAGGGDAVQSDRVVRAVDEAEAYLDEMGSAVRKAGDRDVIDRMARFRAGAEGLIRAVEDDPRELSAARRYLGVYLMGARDAAVVFADLYGRTRSAEAKRDFLALLRDLDQSFGRKTQALLLESGTDLQVEIDVLRDRLRREGLPVESDVT